MNLYLCRWLVPRDQLGGAPTAIAVVRHVTGEKATTAFFDGLRACGYKPQVEDLDTVLLLSDGPIEVISLTIDNGGG